MQPIVKFGVVSDVQYGTEESNIIPEQRPAKLGIEKLSYAIEELNKLDLSFLINLGDLIDRDAKNFEPILEVLNQSKAPVWNALGNHDFSGPEYEYGYLEEALKAFNFTYDTRYYAKEVGAWRFLILDTNDVGVIESAPGSQERQFGQKFIEDIKAQGRINAMPWNGAIGEKQLAWLIDQINDAEKINQNVILFGHHGIYPEHRENLLNDRELLALLSKKPNVKAYINGHDHPGSFGVYEGLVCWNIEGMMDYKDQTAFAYVELTNEKINIHGYGRTKSKEVSLR